ncbi:MAG: hypothetical protein JSS04_26640 [Proteobacteria bacterium]|nr:hypothetical protein [Pseudomonadota bacterium]
MDRQPGSSEGRDLRHDRSDEPPIVQSDLPIPKDRHLFDQLVEVGELIVRLLDAAHDAQDIVEKIVGTDRFKHLGPLKRADGQQVRTEDLKLTVAYWGGGKGRWKPRPFTSNEAPAVEYAAAWGERTGDLYLNDDAFFSNVPQEVWTFQLGGYPVLKKWLGYRQADRRDGRPLTDEERRWFREMIQRIAALLALSPKLDSLYQAVAADAFTAKELQIAR